MYSCHFMDQMDKENTLWHLFFLFVCDNSSRIYKWFCTCVVNKFPKLEHNTCISHLLRNALLSHLEVEAQHVKHELDSFPMTIVVKKLQNLKKLPLSWGTTVVVNWNSLGHQRPAAVSGKGHKHWGLILCRVAQHTSHNLQRAFTYLRRMKNLKGETRQGEKRNAQCFARYNGEVGMMVICVDRDFGVFPHIYNLYLLSICWLASWLIDAWPGNILTNLVAADKLRPDSQCQRLTRFQMGTRFGSHPLFVRRPIQVILYVGSQQRGHLLLTEILV